MAPDSAPDRIALFLYGTLRPGHAMHRIVAPWLESSVPARVWGRLYHLPAGYPAMNLPSEAILATGSNAPEADMLATQGPALVSISRPKGDWDWVQGDLVLLRSPAKSLPPIDEYEDFRPGKPCLYQRVLAAIETESGIVTAWTYVKAPVAGDVLIPDGIWRH